MPRWSLVAVYILVTATFAVTAAWSHSASERATQIAVQVQRDARARVVESCVAQKQRYTSAVNSLTRTYAFLEQSTPSENRSTINRTVRAGLSKQERDVEGLRPASFCKGIGPSVPPIPKRPTDI